MKKYFTAALAVAITAPVVMPQAATAQRNDRDYRNDRNYRGNGDDYRWQGDRNDDQWDASRSYRPDRRARERRLSSNDQVYRGSNGQYYCKRSDGTTGLVIGALGGGVLGNVLGGGTLGTLLGAGAGALGGREIDRNNSDNNRRRNIRCR